MKMPDHVPSKHWLANLGNHFSVKLARCPAKKMDQLVSTLIINSKTGSAKDMSNLICFDIIMRNAKLAWKKRKF